MTEIRRQATTKLRINNEKEIEEKMLFCRDERTS